MTMWFAPIQGAFAVIPSKEATTVVPASDIKPHVFSAFCACQPDANLDDHGVMYVVHHRFEVVEAIERSLDRIFGTPR